MVKFPASLREQMRGTSVAPPEAVSSIPPKARAYEPRPGIGLCPSRLALSCRDEAAVCFAIEGANFGQTRSVPEADGGLFIETTILGRVEGVERFGGEVARIVGVCTDLIEGDTSDAKSSWLERKRAFLAEFRATDVPAQLVSACDKLDNLRSLVADLLEEGPSTLERFNGTPEQIRWYYVEIRDALQPELPIRLRRELDGLIDDLDRLIARE